MAVAITVSATLLAVAITVSATLLAVAITVNILSYSQATVSCDTFLRGGGIFQLDISFLFYRMLTKTFDLLLLFTVTATIFCVELTVIVTTVNIAGYSEKS